MKTVRLLFGALVIVAWGNLAYGADQPASGKVIATVLGEDILASDVEKSDPLCEGDQLNGPQRQSCVESSRRERITALIFGALLEQYRRENNLEPTDREIQDFSRKLDGSQEDQDVSKDGKQLSQEDYVKELEKSQAELMRELRKENLDKLKRKELKEELEEIEDAKKVNVADALREARKKVNAQFILACKTNQSLYNKYGGRVIFQQAGPEPIDAYRDFLKDQESKGNFRVYDEEFKKLFWGYFVSETHTFFSKEDGEKAMQTPWWEMDQIK